MTEEDADRIQVPDEVSDVDFLFQFQALLEQRFGDRDDLPPRLEEAADHLIEVTDDVAVEFHAAQG